MTYVLSSKGRGDFRLNSYNIDQISSFMQLVGEMDCSFEEETIKAINFFCRLTDCIRYVYELKRYAL